MMPEPSVKQKNYIKMKKKKRRTVIFMRLFLFLFFLALWEIAADFGWIDSFIFSSPSRVMKTAFTMLKDGSLLLHIRVTLTETLISFILVVLSGILLAVLLWMFPMVSEILEPALVVLNSLPKSALAPLLIVWLGANIKTIILAGMSVAVFGTILNLYTCFSQISPDREKLIYTLGGTKKAGHIVYMELSYEGEDYNLYAVPVLLDGEAYYLQVVYDFTEEAWSILGARQGIDDSGMAGKELRLLQEGDQLTTVWYVSSISGDDDFAPYEIDTFTVTADTAFDEMALPDGQYFMMFEMRDAMDNCARSDVAVFTCEDGEITASVN